MKKKLIALFCMFALLFLAYSPEVLAEGLGTIEVQGDLTRWHELQAGGTRKGTITLKNTSDETLVAKIYQTDLQYFADGRALFEEAPHHARSNKTWISVIPNQVEIPTGGEDTIHYESHVPPDAGLSGDYWSMIMVENLSKGALEPPRESPGGQNVAMRIETLSRYAVQVLTKIGNDRAGSLKFGETRIQKAEDGLELVVTLEGQGQQVLPIRLWTELFDPQKGSLGVFEGGRFLLHPGCSVRKGLALPSLDKGTYQALVIADGGNENVMGAQINLRIE